VIEALVALRKRKPNWGPKKLLDRQRRLHPEMKLPAASTVSAILKRRGLVEPRRRRRHPERVLVSPMGELSGPNEVWTTDFKGEFRVGSGQMCYPLTIADGWSRFLLACESLSATQYQLTQPAFTRVFQEYGLPARIRSDNGPPFGTHALCGLSRLSVWWLKLGIRVERSRPGKPQDNGRHERMHRTLKEETARPVQAELSSQQERFDAFRREYNEERPHEALSGLSPTDLYEASWRPLTSETPGLDYPAHYERRQVRTDGAIRWHGKYVFVSEVLGREPIGLDEIEDDVWAVYFASLRLGTLRQGKFNAEQKIWNRQASLLILRRRPECVKDVVRTTVRDVPGLAHFG
jgi:transposase InsO family protein